MWAWLKRLFGLDDHDRLYITERDAPLDRVETSQDEWRRAQEIRERYAARAAERTPVPVRVPLRPSPARTSRARGDGYQAHYTAFDASPSHTPSPFDSGLSGGAGAGGSWGDSGGSCGSYGGGDSGGGGDCGGGDGGGGGSD